MKIKLLLSLLFFSLISCSKDDANNNEIVAQETSMNILLNSEKTNITGKDVKRGILPVTVNSVVIKVQPWTTGGGIDPTRVASVFNFNIVADNNTSAADGFEIRNFSTGVSRLSVTANSSSTVQEYVYGNWTNESSTLSVNDLFIKWEAQSPAVNYISNAQTINAVAGINTPVSFTLIPTNGRIISVFQLSNELKDWNYSAKVQTKFEGGSGSGMANVDKTHNGITHLDGYYAYQGAPLKHLVSIFDDKGEKVAEYAVPVTVVNGESVNTIYTILSDKIPEGNKLQTTILVPDFKSPLPDQKDI
ncbi:MAG: hypothetical protein REI96_04520 [Flavobacterium nitrogenifigens]|uniref:Uncharacterized protein n=1 Tax=Flavobacterium nitrogenifigens TaxID=1617283 RepID=A0A521EWP0_9FLAO|nr:hypothetical protein [Flavobacterium nitrogenifigens]KAF2333399.1 hypothetical protein DM397_09680 [Flavobacterium nitrogenifigens]MDQ8011687.1 hypothetical protein [Flavobacterium nitrogenifigens]SMO87530.1 hypothetical protein SAMN06265220_105116 [Flavobacterium nitrogenifigens]